MKNYYDAIIIGGGAAGLMCAWQAGLLGQRVVVLERSKKIGRKILMSGGGRLAFRLTVSLITREIMVNFFAMTRHAT